jgi:hypothetical protein
MTRSNLPATIGAGASEQIKLAEALAAANLLPDQYRRNPANLLWAIQYAEALGVHPMTAITGINVISGKPTASAQLIGGLVRRAGHKLRVESSDTKAIAKVIRADDPDYTFVVEWTMERARKAGLGGRGPWQSYPAAMLAARAITEVARLACPEALFGIIYTAEELGADVDEDGIVVAPVTVEVERVEDPFVITDDRAELPADPEVQEGEVVLGTPAARNQKTRIAILRKELGIDDEAYRKRLQSLYGVTSATELTTDQAADLIEKLTEAKQRKEASDASAA